MRNLNGHDRHVRPKVKKLHLFIRDAPGLIAIAFGLYLAADYVFAGLVLFICGLSALALNRRTHSRHSIAKVSQYVCTCAPIAVILTFVGGVLAGFERHLTRADFGMFYSVALQLRSDPGHLYDTAAQERMLATVTGGLTNHYLTFPYPPFVAAVFAPLSYLSFRDAYFVMLGCNLLLLVIINYVLCKSLCRTREQVFAVILACAALLPIYITLALGQVALWGVLLFSLLAVDLLGKREWRAGLWVGLLSYKLTLVPIPFLLLLLNRAWGGVLVSLSVVTLLVAVSLMLVGFQGLTANYQILGMMADESLIPRMQSLRALTYYSGLPEWSFWTLSVIAMGALWLIARRGGAIKWILAAAVLGNLLCSPYLQSYDLSLAAVAIALAVSSFSEVPDWKRTALMLLAFVPAFVAVAGQVSGKNWPAVPVVLIVVFVYCLRKALRDQVSTPILWGGNDFAERRSEAARVRRLGGASEQQSLSYLFLSSPNRMLKKPNF